MLSIIYNIIIEPFIYIVDLAFSLSYRLLHNPGLAVICVSFIVNLLCMPLYRMADEQQQAERDKQKSMEHWVTHIKKHFSGDEQYMILTTYYRQQGYSQLSQLKGSFSLLLQIPIFIAAYRYLSDLAVFKYCSFLFIQNLAEPDQLISLGGFTINVLPLVMTALNMVSSAVYTKGFPLRDKIQTYGLALVFLVLLYDRPSGLVMYWTCNQIFSLVKNIFTRVVPNPRRILCIAGEAVLLLGIAALAARGSISTTKRLAFVVMVVALAQVVVFAPYLRKLIPFKSGAPEGDRTPIRTYLLAALLVAVVVGLMVPSALIGDSPAEFVDLADYVDPLTYLLHNTLLTLGLFVLWVGVFFYLSDEQGRNTISFLLWCLAGICLVNYLAFGRNLGVIDSELHFDKTPVFSRAEELGNLLAIALVVLAFTIIWKRFHFVVNPMLGIMALAVIGVSVPNLTSIRSITASMLAENEAKMSEAGKESSPLVDEDGNPNALFNLSTEGKNVVVLFLDRGLAATVPYIMEECPSLYEKLDGFTFYPNTISYGGHTVFGAPPLYGGYEYTPEAMNKRTDMLLVDKHNESIKVLPTLFADEGYKVTITDPAYLDYESNTYDYSSLADLDADVYHTLGAYAKPYVKKYLGNDVETMKRRFAYYSLFKCVPVLGQRLIYSDGQYLAPSSFVKPTRDFLNNYSVIDSLPKLTNIAKDNSNNFLLLHNMMTHAPNELQLPNYEPEAQIDNSNLETGIRSAEGWPDIKLDSTVRIQHYDSNAAMLLRLGEWCDYLREQGVYDNTRIILVSDHAHRGLQFFEDMVFDSSDVNRDGNRFNPVLMVKDFGATGFNTSMEFMTNADTPTLALDGIVENPVNPFTGNPIDSSEKTAHPQLVTSSHNWRTYVYQTGNVFDTSDEPWYSVEKNIFEPENWVKIEDEESASQ